MKIVVIGGSGLIGGKLVARLRPLVDEVISASPSSGVNTLTGEGLPEALRGAHAVVDVTNSPSFEDSAVMHFFDTSTRNLMAAEAAAGVGRHVALSVVGTDRLQDSGYFRAKLAQENRIKASGIPHTIVRATQFFEFMGAIAKASGNEEAAYLPPALFQPIAADDIAAALADVTMGSATAMIEVAGPEALGMDEAVRQYLAATHDARRVITDPHARYFGLELTDESLTPGSDARLGPTRYADWLGRLDHRGPARPTPSGREASPAIA